MAVKSFNGMSAIFAIGCVKRVGVPGGSDESYCRPHPSAFIVPALVYIPLYVLGKACCAL